mmetsp:Transcript_106809/g.334988  ORF Transcript_106809/g.334988 Transcript_106809/m.334988 type:complete len:284 (-) Transcript_106809:260-1111(-)
MPVECGLVGGISDGHDGVVELGIHVPLRYVPRHELQHRHVDGGAADRLQHRLGLGHGVGGALGDSVADVLHVILHLLLALRHLHGEAHAERLLRCLLGSGSHEVLQIWLSDARGDELAAILGREPRKIELRGALRNHRVKGAAEREALARDLALHEAHDVHGQHPEEEEHLLELLVTRGLVVPQARAEGAALGVDAEQADLAHALVQLQGGVEEPVHGGPVELVPGLGVPQPDDSHVLAGPLELHRVVLPHLLGEAGTCRTSGAAALGDDLLHRCLVVWHVPL